MGWRSSLACVFVLAGITFSAAQAAVQVALVPSATTVAPGTTFEVKIRVLQPGAAFNAYQAIVHYDPAALTFLPATPLSLQEGSYMTSACGATFHWFTSGTTEVGMVHSLTCAGQSLNGPGDLYLLRFRATGAAQTTPIRFVLAEFANAGNPVAGVQSFDTSVTIEQPSDAGSPPARRVTLRVTPNPFNPSTVIEVDAETAGQQRLEIFSAAGRPVRVLQDGAFPAGVRRVAWDGRDENGARLASGVYLVRLGTRAGMESVRVVLTK